ncbi:hypothetical protein BMG03_01080 [Thioclava nitratireducens]|uniref:Uncharacterized protein n=1 Tax=Thioclava nitratireducens TaxID=1915078 RepID=A0ABM6ID01_9RHOB|nr:hypothetical protein [Thioclava nitratireducens]AQS46549.1 hypothetical protein BMG03_01080 [Thioclava nitratireducens]
MCNPAFLAPLFSTAGATAAGATAAASLIPAAGSAAAATAGAAATGFSALQTIGTIASIGGTLYSGIAGAKAAQAQADAIGQQMETEKQLNAIEDNRRRKEMRSAIAQQRAELAARGVQLDSPTAIALGQAAGRELSFESQAVRSGGQAKQIELSSARRAALADKTNSWLRGTTSAAGKFLTAAPELWPGFARGGVLQ